MSRMTASIKRINEHLEKVSGMDGESSDIMENVLEPLVSFICGQIYRNSISQEIRELQKPCMKCIEKCYFCMFNESKKCEKCKNYKFYTPMFKFCPHCGRKLFER